MAYAVLCRLRERYGQRELWGEPGEECGLGQEPGTDLGAAG
jgi:hypothetical protein